MKQAYKNNNQNCSMLVSFRARERDPECQTLPGSGSGSPVTYDIPHSIVLTAAGLAQDG